MSLPKSRAALARDGQDGQRGNQIGNLRLLIEAAEADLSQCRERAKLADTTVAWLNMLRERAEEIEEDTPDDTLPMEGVVVGDVRNPCG